MAIKINFAVLRVHAGGAPMRGGHVAGGVTHQGVRRLLRAELQSGTVGARCGAGSRIE